MARRGRRIAVGITITLMFTGFVALLFSSMGGVNDSLIAPDLSPTLADGGDFSDLGIFSLSVSGGTLVLVPDYFTNPFSIASLFVAAGTVTTETRDSIRERRLKDRVFDEIVQNPGVHLRELHRLLGCAMGALQYHITKLIDEGSVISIKNGNSRHFFVKGFSGDEQVLRLTALTRNPTVRSILAESMNNGQITQADLSRSLSIEKSLISYYTTSLVKLGVFNTVRVFGRERPVVLSEWARTAITGLGLLV